MRTKGYLTRGSLHVAPEEPSLSHHSPLECYHLNYELAGWEMAITKLRSPRQLPLHVVLMGDKVAFWGWGVQRAGSSLYG